MEIKNRIVRCNRILRKSVSISSCKLKITRKTLLYLGVQTFSQNSELTKKSALWKSSHSFWLLISQLYFFFWTIMSLYLIVLQLHFRNCEKTWGNQLHIQFWLLLEIQVYISKSWLYILSFWSFFSELREKSMNCEIKKSWLPFIFFTPWRTQVSIDHSSSNMTVTGF